VFLCVGMFYANNSVSILQWIKTVFLKEKNIKWTFFHCSLFFKDLYQLIKLLNKCWSFLILLIYFIALRWERCFGILCFSYHGSNLPKIEYLNCSFILRSLFYCVMLRGFTFRKLHFKVFMQVISLDFKGFIFYLLNFRVVMFVFSTLPHRSNFYFLRFFYLLLVFSIIFILTYI
jgi:hypothetical protein